VDDAGAIVSVDGDEARRRAVRLDTRLWVL
jgi:hypothetical protein